MGSAFTSVRTLSLRRRVLAAVALLLCLVAGLAGIVDHLVGDSAMQLAALEAHYCIHGPKPAGVDCSRVDPDGMAQAWHQREIGYAGAIAFGLLIAVIAAFPIRRQRPSAPEATVEARDS